MANGPDQMQVALMVIMACLGCSLAVNALINPSKENKDALAKTRNAQIAPGARR